MYQRVPEHDVKNITAGGDGGLGLSHGSLRVGRRFHGATQEEARASLLTLESSLLSRFD